MPFVVSPTLDVSNTELGVPESLELIPLGFEIPRGQFRIEVGACLLDADEGGAYLDFDDRICLSVELRERSHGIASHLGAVRYRQNALIDALSPECLPEAGHEIAFEVG